MWHDIKLPKPFWPEYDLHYAVNLFKTATYPEFLTLTFLKTKVS